jgi:hypothetical protein
VITHLNSGLTMAGPYAGLEEARRLASILVGIDWRREVDVISRRELAATRQVVEAYNEALAEARATCAAPTGAACPDGQSRGRSGDRALVGSGMQPADLFRLT